MSLGCHWWLRRFSHLLTASAQSNDYSTWRSFIRKESSFSLGRAIVEICFVTSTTAWLSLKSSKSSFVFWPGTPTNASAWPPGAFASGRVSSVRDQSIVFQTSAFSASPTPPACVSRAGRLYCAESGNVEERIFQRRFLLIARASRQHERLHRGEVALTCIHCTGREVCVN